MPLFRFLNLAFTITGKLECNGLATTDYLALLA